MRSIIVIACLLAAGLAGCTDDSSPSATDGETPRGEGAGATGTGGDEAGQESGGATGAGGSGTGAGTTEAAVEERDVRHEGMTSRGTCTFTIVTSACAVPSSDAWIYLPAGTAALTGQLTWSAESPLTEDLYVYLLKETGSGWIWEEGYPYDFGASPLSIDWDLERHADDSVAVYVGSAWGACAMVACTFAYPGQPFLLEATAMVRS